MIINVEFGKTYESLYNLRINQHFLEELRKQEQFSGQVGLLHGQNSQWDLKMD
jgi:hypothetical protein